MVQAADTGPCSVVHSLLTWTASTNESQDGLSPPHALDVAGQVRRRSHFTIRDARWVPIQSWLPWGHSSLFTL